MAAEMLAAEGHRVWIAEAKPSPARKFLMAGKSGLNITKATDAAGVIAACGSGAEWLAPAVAAFDPEAVQRWCEGLGQAVFTGSSQRVFPVAMKGSPLLRAWLARLDAGGVVLKKNWRWQGFEGQGAAVSSRFDTPEGPVVITPKVTILALGGASWARLGSDGAWEPILAQKGIEISPFAPANMGFEVRWSAHMAPHFGAAIKAAALVLPDGRRERGEFVLSARGIEGGGIYAIARDLREGAQACIDFFPELSLAALEAKLAKGRRGDSVSGRLRKLGLSPQAVALIMEWSTPSAREGAKLAALLKALPLRHDGPRPLDEAISVAGGIRAQALSAELELRALPSVFACGEMLDWEAPTGGYLLTVSMATGRLAGLAAARRLQQQG